MTRRIPQLIRVYRSPLDHRRGRIVGPGLDARCAFGRSGTVHAKREGDGATPVGRFRVLGALYRADRMTRPRTILRLRALAARDGWCDDPRDRRYNRPVRLPYPAGHEGLWREDRLYDLVLDLSCNRDPVIRGRGSAIFLHVAGPNLKSTEGCVATDVRQLRRLLAMIGPRTVIQVVA